MEINTKILRLLSAIFYVVWTATVYAATPIDLFSGADIPRIWKLELDDRIVFGLFNWVDDATQTTWSFKDLELKAGAYKLTDLWSGNPVVLDKNGLTLSMPPHTVRLIEFRK
jgi:hypothetical protein